MESERVKLTYYGPKFMDNEAQERNLNHYGSAY